MKIKLFFSILISLILVSCSTQKSLNKNMSAENDCVVPQENTLKYKSRKAYSTMRHRVKMNKSNNQTNRNRTANINPRVDTPLMLSLEEQSIEEIKSSLNAVEDNWNALEASWNELKDSWDDPQLRDIDLQDLFSLANSEQSKEAPLANTQPSTISSKDQTSAELHEINFTPAFSAPDVASAETNAAIIMDYQNNMELAAGKKRKRGDRLLYLASAFIGLFSIGFHRAFRKNGMTLTRWSKVNAGKAQVLIAGLQTLLIGLAIYSGHNLREMGFEISETPSYIFGGLMAAGFLSTPFLPKRDLIAVPREVNMQRLKYLGIILSALMIFTSYGNNLVSNRPDSRAAMILTSMDQTISPTQDDISIGDKEPEPKKYRWGVLILGLLAIGLLLYPLCAGICIASSGGLALLGGGALAGASVAAMIAAAIWVIRRFKVKT